MSREQASKHTYESLRMTPSWAPLIEVGSNKR